VIGCALAIILTSAIVFGPSMWRTAFPKIKFDVRAELKGSTLELSLDTDLPDDTPMCVGVYRTYRMKDHPGDFPIDYFHEWGTVGEWRQVRSVSVDYSVFRKEFEQVRVEAAYAGWTTAITEVSDSIQADFAVPNNQNLDKSATVDIPRGGLWIVEWQKDFLHPLDREPPKEVPKVNIPPLEVGHTYRLAQETLLMPVVEPSTRKQFNKEKTVNPGGQIRVIKVSKGNLTSALWYRVSATNADGTAVGEGWINGVFLIRQPPEKLD
jgi:hypothetical protein